MYVDGAASFHSHIVLSGCFHTHTFSPSNKLFYLPKNASSHHDLLCFAMQRLHLNDPGNKDMVDTLSRLYRFASITGKHKKGYYSQGLPLVLFTQS